MSVGYRMGHERARLSNGSDRTRAKHGNGKPPYGAGVRVQHHRLSQYINLNFATAAVLLRGGAPLQYGLQRAKLYSTSSVSLIRLAPPKAFCTSTASATQVRQPIYNSAIGRWRSYQNEIKPLLKALQLDAQTNSARSA
jgi:hypothetical protein